MRQPDDIELIIIDVIHSFESDIPESTLQSGLADTA
jgi:hypothetical protein